MLSSCRGLVSLLLIRCLAMFSYNEVTEVLLINVFGANLVLLFFIAWQFIHFVRCLRHCIRQARRRVIAISGRVVKMDCDELIDQLLSAQGAGAGRAEGSPPAAAPAGGTAVTPDAPQGLEEERVQKSVKGSLQ